MQSKKITSTVVVENIDNEQECFVIMPISDPEGYDKGHFSRVYNDIFIPAIKTSGFKPFRADDNKSASLIQLEILRKLIESPMAICDLSSRNPNVLFELGIRQAFDKPVVLVQEIGTPRIFDISSINTIDYRKERIYHEVLEDQSNIAEAIKETYSSWKSGSAINSIVKLLSLNKPANLPDIEEVKKDPMVQYIMSEISELKSEMRNLRPTSRERGVDEEYLYFKNRLNRFKGILDKMAAEGNVSKAFMYDVRENFRHCHFKAQNYGLRNFYELSSEYEHLLKLAERLYSERAKDQSQIMNEEIS